MNTLKNQFSTALSSIYLPAECSELFRISAAKVCQVSYSMAVLYKDKDFTDKQAEEMKAILILLKNNTPIQYILGETSFFGLNFKLSPAVLIPRPETSELIEWILEEKKGEQELKILDIGTGSGCIAITLAHLFPSSKVSAIDISPTALALAKQNAKLNQVKVNFLLADVLKANGECPYGKFDLIVSNPPYICEKEAIAMDLNVTENEPHLALFVPDNDPLIFYKKITEIASNSLNKGGSLFLEINQRLGQETLDLCHNMGFNGELRKDLSQNDRMIKAKFN